MSAPVRAFGSEEIVAEWSEYLYLFNLTDRVRNLFNSPQFNGKNIIKFHLRMSDSEDLADKKAAWEAASKVAETSSKLAETSAKHAEALRKQYLDAKWKKIEEENIF